MTPRVAIPRPRRWAQPFDPDMSDDAVERALDLHALRLIDPSQFPATLALRDIIRNDARVRRFRRGDVIVEKGDYGSSVFFVMSGTVRAVLDSGRRVAPVASRSPTKRNFFQAASQLWRNAKVPERRDIKSYGGNAVNGKAHFHQPSRKRAVGNVEALVANNPTRILGEQQMFGEVAALSRTPHEATVFADSDVELIELRWQGLREIRQRDKRLRQEIDGLYRTSSLKAHLRESPLFRHLDKEALEYVAQHTLFATHGAFEWASGFREIASKSPEAVIESEPLVIEQGNHLDGLLLVRSGFCRITSICGSAERSVGYLTRNDAFGLGEIVEHWRNGAELRAEHGLRAVGFVDLLLVPTTLVEEYVLPSLPEQQLSASATETFDIRSTGDVKNSTPDFEQSMLDFLVNGRTINGTAAMFINTDRCTACDECVRACAAAHDGNPRFVRHGPEHDKAMVANACMHCVDAVCLIGCPTGAIHRDAADGAVIINDTTCIGCATCAQSCPYDNIRMVEIRDDEGAFVVDDETHMPVVKATKCDLCRDQIGGPACERACPHDALVRLDMRDHPRLADWLRQ